MYDSVVGVDVAHLVVVRFVWPTVAALLAACQPAADTADIDVGEDSTNLEPLALSPEPIAALEVARLGGESASPVDSAPLWDGTAPADIGQRWLHPLAGPRALPASDGRRFGASRPGQRPDECGLGHCGVDLGFQRGAIVYAAASGTIATTHWSSEGRAGRYVRIRHDGARSDYMHLDRIREDLEPGVVVKAGEPIGTVGATGIRFSGPHLHFAVALWFGDRWIYIDPEPVLATALIHDGPASLRSIGRGPVSLVTTPHAADSVAALEVEVLDAHSHSSIDGVVAVARGPGGKAVARVRRGQVLFRGLAPGEWTVTIDVPGYQRAQRRYDVASSVGQAPASGRRIELRRGATLAGVVRDRDGIRVAGAEVLVGAVKTITDGHGHFSVRNAPTGSVLLWAQHEGGRGELELNVRPGEEQLMLQLTLDVDG